MEAISKATGKLDADPTPQIRKGQQKRMFRCTKCSYQSVFKSNFNIHMRYMHGTEKRPKQIKKFKCPGCPKKFSIPSVMKKHFSAQHKGEMPFSCVFCEKRFSTSNRCGLKNHVKVHIRELHYSCIICDYSTTSRASLKSHIRHRHEGLTAEERKQKMKVCPVCKILVNHLRDHLRKHTGERPHHCGTCRKSFKYSSSLKDHQLVFHEGQKPHCCEVCQAKFGRVGDLKAHLRYVHGPEKRPFVKRRLDCVFCDKNMAYANQYSHYRRHIHEYPYNCPNCDKSFVSAGDLKWHVDKHHYFKVPVKKRVECNICNKTLCNKQSLAKHMCGHTGERPFPCSTCEKRFTSAGGLRRHSLMHTGKPFSCTICSSTFLERCGLDVHMRRVHGTENAQNRN